MFKLYYFKKDTDREENKLILIDNIKVKGEGLIINGNKIIIHIPHWKI